MDTLRRFWDKLCEAGTLRSDSGASLKAVGIPSQGGEDVKLVNNPHAEGGGAR